MTKTKKYFGAHGEQQAKNFLIEKGYRFVEENFCIRGGEIDLIMEDKKTLVFVEVKYRNNFVQGPAEEAITPNKIHFVTRTALLYIKARGFLERAIRFDVVIIDNNGVKHYPDAFQARGNYYY